MKQYLVTVGTPEIVTRCRYCPYVRRCKETIKVKVRYTDPYEDAVVLYVGSEAYVIV